jgi:hypothetical protein
MDFDRHLQYLMKINNLIAALLFYVSAGEGLANPLISHDSKTNAAQSQIEQAADQFDAFSWQIPIVIKAKFNSFMKHGFRAILMEDTETKPAEDEMINSLSGGLRNISNALQDDMDNYLLRNKTNENIPPNYHSVEPTTTLSKKH